MDLLVDDINRESQNGKVITYENSHFNKHDLTFLNAENLSTIENISDLQKVQEFLDIKSVDGSNEKSIKSEIVITLNEAQTNAINNIKNFLQSEEDNFLLLGPGGSGKTTVITNAFNNSTYRLAFCAFTNKATQVLKSIAEKFHVTFKADFSTIHKLLMLEIKYFDKETEIAFDFDVNKIDYLKEYDVIIFDECSTISSDLYSYIKKTQEYLKFSHSHNIKFIFIGDYWQLPPVGEDKSVVFDEANKSSWLVSKLNKVMRCNNDDLLNLNSKLLSWINVFKSKEIDQINKVKSLVPKYPYSLTGPLKESLDLYVSNQEDFLDTYLYNWQNNPDIVILTYSRSNCKSTNEAIQTKLDIKAKRKPPAFREEIKFNKGDRCCLDKPIDVYEVVKKLDVKKEEYVTLGEAYLDSLYNGEIFDIIDVADVKIKTELNKLSCMKNHKYFFGQLLTVSRIQSTSNVSPKRYEIIHIPEPIVNQARRIIKMSEKKSFYISVMSNFLKRYPHLEYGYCITIYKSQGSEWKHVLVNMNSIKWSIIGKDNRANTQKTKVLFKTTYTALSRAQDRLTLFWF